MNWLILTQTDLHWTLTYKYHIALSNLIKIITLLKKTKKKKTTVVTFKSIATVLANCLLVFQSLLLLSFSNDGNTPIILQEANNSRHQLHHHLCHWLTNEMKLQIRHTHTRELIKGRSLFCFGKHRNLATKFFSRGHKAPCKLNKSY